MGDEEFQVATAAYRVRPGIIECPHGGSADLVVLDPGDDPGPGPSGA